MKIKPMGKVLSLVLSLTLAGSCFPGLTFTAAAATLGDSGITGGVYWELENDGTLTVSPDTGTVIPDSFAFHLL